MTRWYATYTVMVTYPSLLTDEPPSDTTVTSSEAFSYLFTAVTWQEDKTAAMEEVESAISIHRRSIYRSADAPVYITVAYENEMITALEPGAANLPPFTHINLEACRLSLQPAIM